MTDIEEWIEEAKKDNALSFEALSASAAGKVVRAAQGRFVNGNPLVWWLSLRFPFTSVSSVNVNIGDVVPTGDDMVYLIPETESPNLPVYLVNPSDVEILRRECPPFEYYVSDKSFEWLLIETDHDEFIMVNHKKE